MAKVRGKRVKPNSKIVSLKSTYKWGQNDSEFLKAHGRGGTFIIEEVAKEFKISKNKIDMHIKMGHITVERTYTAEGWKNVSRISNAGAKWLKENTTVKFNYRGNLRQVNHDIALSRKYLSLHPKARDTWVTENDLNKDWSKYCKTGTPKGNYGTLDALCVIHGKLVAIEVITDNYSGLALEMKENAAIELGVDEFCQIRVK